MTFRWRILILLFLLRMLMAFQFASIGAIAPMIESVYQVDAAAIGGLIGMYFVPGIFVALAGGAMVSKIGDKRIVLVGLLLMAVGASLMALNSSWDAQTSGRFIGGIGGVILNVVMSKMVMDWFAGREIATAMTIFINSWPAGIALALIVQPQVVQFGGLTLAFGLESVLSVIGFLALLMIYRSPESEEYSDKSVTSFPMGNKLIAIINAGMVWGLFNAALAIAFSFTPTLLVERGSSLATAGASTSLVMWGVVVTGILGGYLSDRIRQPMLLLIFASLGFALLLLAMPRLDGHMLVIAGLGAIAGFCVGPIMTLPANTLTAETRATGMGIFYALYYLCFSVSPWLSGQIISRYGVSRVFDFGAAIAISTLVFLVFYRYSFRTKT